MRKLRIARILLAALSFACTCAVFADFTGALGPWLGWLPRVQIWPAALAGALALTAVAGRVYCSVACPLGILQDGMIFLRRLFGFRFTPAPAPKGVKAAKAAAKWSVLLAVAGGAAMGVHLHWLEPYGIYGRAAGAVFGPLSRMANNALAEWAARAGSYAFHAVEFAVPALSVLALSGASACAVAALALWKGRLWCAAACPVGTALGCVSRFAAFRPRIDAEKCVECGACAAACRTRSIDVKAKRVDASACVVCFDCAAACRKGAIRWSK